MWDDTPFTRDELDDLVAEARNGVLVIGAPISQTVLDALSRLADAFPDSTPELVSAVYDAFQNVKADLA